MKQFRSDSYQMKCGSYEAEKRRYNLYKGRSGRRWLVADQPNCADNIYVEGGPNSDGFGGRTLSFTLVNGEVVELKGPWHSNSDAFLNDTGVNINNKYLTYGAIGHNRNRDNKNWYVTVIDDVIYQDEEPIIGEFDRIDKIAQQLANQLGKTLYYYRQTEGGSSSGPITPETEV